MRKLIVSLLSATALVLGAVHAQADCQDIFLQHQRGTFDGVLCVEGSTITLDGEAFVFATGKTYTIDADATVTGTPGHYVVSGTVVISDETGVIKTITFTCPGGTAVTAAASFVSKAINYTLSQKPPKPWPPLADTVPLPPAIAE